LFYYTKQEILMLEIGSSPKCIAELEQFVETISKRYHISEDKYPDILISLTEAVNNAMIHGNRLSANKKIQISYSFCNASISFKVSHQGRGFDPGMVADPTSVENIHKCGGRGIYLMKNLCNRVEYSNQGKTVELEFSIH
jgi:serine/threonine-protein kinase RsbW